MAVALVNYSIVQSVVGSVASNYFSEQWGGKVKIGSIGFNPVNHLSLRNVELISPTGDTICEARRLDFGFSKFPVGGDGVAVGKARLKDVYFYLAIDTNGLNLKYIIDYFGSSESTGPTDFVVLVDELRLENVRYKQDLVDRRDEQERLAVKGVDVKHMDYRKINAVIRNVRVDKDHVTCRIDRMSTEEVGGLNMKELRANVFVTHSGISVTNLFLETADSRLVGDVLLDYTRWKSMSCFLDSVFFTCNFEPGSYGGLHDAALWTDVLWGMDERVNLEGCFSGPIADFHADGVHLGFGYESELDLDASIVGLPHIKNTVITAEIRNLHTTYADLAAVKHPAWVKRKADGVLSRLHTIDLSASFAGTIYDFDATASLSSTPGNVDADLHLEMCPKTKMYAYSGKAVSDGFNIGRMAPNEWVSRSAFDIVFEGKGFDPKTMEATADGRLFHTVVKGQRLMGETTLDVVAAGGRVDADAILEDALADIRLHGDVEWNDERVTYGATVDAGHVDLKRLGLWKENADSVAFADIVADGRYVENANGNTFANMNVKNFALRSTSGKCRIGDVSLRARERNKWKTIILRSDVANAKIEGYFRYDGLGQMISKFANDYLPEKLVGGSGIAEDYDRIADSRFELNAELTDTFGIIQFFVPGLAVATGTTIQANYNFVESFKSIVRSDSIRWGNVVVYDVGMNSEALSDTYKMRLTSEAVRLGGVTLADNGDMSVESTSRQTMCRMRWDNGSQVVGGGDVNFRVVSDSVVRLIVDPSQMSLGGERWGITDYNKDNYFVTPEYDLRGRETRRGGFEIGGLGLEQLTAADGKASSLHVAVSRMGERTDSINVVFSDFDMGVVNTFVGELGLSVAGVLDGTVEVRFLSDGGAGGNSGSSGVGSGAGGNSGNSGGAGSSGNSGVGGVGKKAERKEVPYLTADLKIDDLLFDGERLGDVRMISSWNADMNQLNLYVNSEASRENGGKHGVDTYSPLMVTGYVGLGSDGGELNFDVAVEDVGIAAAKPFVAGFSSDIDGRLSAELEVKGTLEKPEIDGFVAVDSGSVLVDLLNVRYLLTDTVLLERDAIVFNRMVVGDEEGNNAVIDGRIGHTFLKDMRFDLNVKSDKLLCMNTTAEHSDVYHGRVVAAVDGHVGGLADNIDVVLNARTLAGTYLEVPINDSRQVASADYIHFVSDRDYYNPVGITMKPVETMSSGTESGGRFLLTVNVETTPDMTMRLPMDFSSVESDVVARGSGDLQLQIGTGKPFALVGDYEISSGTVLLDLLGVLSKEFSIDEGSSITFPGNVSEALFDIKAVYSQRVNLSTLTGTLSSAESQKSVTVENIIALNGTLQSPDIDFDLRLPNADQSVQEEVFAYIDKNNERDMLNQTMSLLLQKKFYNSSANSANDASGMTANDAYGLLASIVGGMVNDMVQFVDVNFEYQAGTALTTDQYAVDISKEWNKLYFESTFGFGGESREMSGLNGNNNMTGDMLVGYKFNPRLHLFVFNRSNTNDYTRSDLPYKQGLGLKYMRDFDNLGELFARRKRK